MVKIVDCTLRDGGYYNNWDFPRGLISKYLKAMGQSHIDVVELGFRSLINDSFKGACAFTTDDFLQELDIPDGLSVGVMVNASELIADKLIKKKLRMLFPVNAEETPVDIVRIACHMHEFEDALQAVSFLKDKGFAVGFNLMQVADRSQEEIATIARLATSYPLDVLYFADSMGSMDPTDVSTVIDQIRTAWLGPIGIHTHDNCGMALSNTMTAISKGVEWVDSTVTGMGRGPGNAMTEELMVEITQLRDEESDFGALFDLAVNEFQPLKQQFGWGKNPFYYLSGKYSIHPTFVQEMLADTRYSHDDILSVIFNLRKTGGRKFSAEILDEALNDTSTHSSTGSWDPRAMFDGCEVLLLGPGEGCALHGGAIKRWIKKSGAKVLSLNAHFDEVAKVSDATVACNPARMEMDRVTYLSRDKPLIAPSSALTTQLRNSLNNGLVFDYGMRIEPGVFKFEPMHCVIPEPLALAYALAIVTSGGATRVFLAGFDGYGVGDSRNQQVNELISTYKASPGSLSVVAITPTAFNIRQASVYGM